MLAPALAAARGALRGTSLPGDEHAEQAAGGQDASRSARPGRGRARSWAALIARPQRGFGGRVQDRIVRSMPAQLTRRAKQRGFAATSAQAEVAAEATDLRGETGSARRRLVA